jgi:hypothetical protein
LTLTAIVEVISPTGRLPYAGATKLANLVHRYATPRRAHQRYLELVAEGDACFHWAVQTRPMAKAASRAGADRNLLHRWYDPLGEQPGEANAAGRAETPFWALKLGRNCIAPGSDVNHWVPGRRSRRDRHTALAN